MKARALAANRARNLFTVSYDNSTTLGSFDSRPLGLGGWTLSAHHWYDATSGTLYLGDGTRRRAQSSGNIIERLIGAAGQLEESGPPQSVAVATDGSVFVATHQTIDRYDPKTKLEGPLFRFYPEAPAAFNACETSLSRGDGGPARSACVGDPKDLAVEPDGSLLIVDHEQYRHYIRRLSPDGIVRRVAGVRGPNDGVTGFGCTSSPDGTPALSAILCEIDGIVVGRDSMIYFLESSNIRRIAADGTLETVLRANASVTPAPNVSQVNASLAMGPDGSIYFSAYAIVGRLHRDGHVTVAAGNGTYGHAGDGGLATAANIKIVGSLAVGSDGSLYIYDD